MGTPRTQRATARSAATEPSHSGRLLLRMPRELHSRLAEQADAAGMSLNQHIVAALSRVADGEPTPTEASRRPQGAAGGMPRALRLSLIANGIVVLLAAGTALAILLTH